MTALKAPTRRVATALALAAGAALTLSACGAGQISQTATQVAAVNGNSAELGDIALRNVHVIYPDSEEYSLEPGGKAALGFTVVNLSETTPDELTRITTDFASSTTGVSGLRIEPQASISAGLTGETLAEDATAEAATDESPRPAEAAESSDTPSVAQVELTGLKEGVRPGLTIPVTFTFAEAGDVTMQVPVDAGTDVERNVSEKSPVEGDGH
ncbi:LpqE protein [Rhodococcus ruber Chol-4]|uniref:Uncharacterized protein n=1 Tax=Rhodococcus ruber TaxID=1830 RepID=A0A098BQS8_9NOCA|nr:MULTISPECIES: hypothetical protein [Rhodococcus]MDO2377330.1 hypothetical protein [Rhodococcus ruber]RIK13951.1 MAG: hypothetical protein DCC47_01370 [Acidobacteriota bacterium]ATQ30644.1 hypothetical protein CS378_19200 [Rhodococcus ruber]AUM16859.1 hypothetical protein CSW53_10080 [Rhodococcus ruber]AWG97587.1 hypothetical protein DCN13_02880 [Rhodococcus ruber]